MKKFNFIITFILSLSMLFGGCKQEFSFVDYVSELRNNCYQSIDSDFNIKGGYGYIENDNSLDKNSSNKIWLLTFKLLDKELENATFNISLSFNNKVYQSEFKFNPISHSLSSSMEIENFNLNEFEITLSHGGKQEVIKMQSCVPEKTISLSSALDFLYEQQPSLINSYFDSDGNFTAKIIARLIVKEDKSYWYIGLSDQNSNLKALLIDGFNGEVLAIRDIFK